MQMTNGTKCKPARYYDKLFGEENIHRMEEIKKSRMSMAEKSIDNTRRRLRTREIVKNAQYKQLKRSYENG